MTEAKPTKFYRKWSLIALHFFLISALVGSLLRYYNVNFISDLNYRNIVHAHSHVAMLGWLHLGLTTLLIYHFRRNQFRKFRNVQIVTLISVVGMLISFPIEGYGPISISFSTLFVFATYWFTYLFFRLRESAIRPGIAERAAGWSLIFLVISSFGPWTLGPLMVWGDGTEVLYNLSVYFYLHFAYNGFFQIAVLAIILSVLPESLQFTIKGKWFTWLMIGSVIPSYALSALWTNPSSAIWLIGAISGIAQLMALIIATPIIRSFMKSRKDLWTRILAMIAMICWYIKNLLQALSAIPALQEFTYNTRVYTVIGFIHLVMLGFLSLFIILLGTENRLYHQKLIGKVGVGLMIIGLVFSEGLLFGNGLLLEIKGEFLTFYPKGMLYASIIMTAGIAIFWLNQFSRKNKKVGQLS